MSLEEKVTQPSGWETEPPNNADVFFEALQEAGVDYIFAVLGSDHASLIEAYEKRRNRQRTSPEVLIFHHEFVAISAADGYARITGKPQCVLVHVDVGTAALGQGLHNASSGKAPLLIFAGEAPTTVDGAVQGSRSEHVQWYQDVVSQESIVAPYSRYSNKIAAGDNVKKTMKRALLMATTGCPGPVYLTATREVLASPAVLRNTTSPQHAPSCRTGTISDEDITLLAGALLTAKAPLVITGYLGRSHRAVKALVQLANLVKGIQVFDSEFRDMSFPADHPAKISQRTGARPAIEGADVILVLDADVPWIPTKIQPPDETRIFHIDQDPRKEYMRTFDIGAEITWNADCGVALEQLSAHVHGHELYASQATVFEYRWVALQRKHAERLALLTSLASPPKDGRISVDMLFATLRESLPSDTIYASDVVTNQVALNDQLQLRLPGTNLTKGGSGLGWAIGAAIGIKLASRIYDFGDRPNVKRLDHETDGTTERFVCCVIGDGSFLFSSPAAGYLATTRLNTPFLTIVVNNGGWKATRSCIKDVHPNGAADNATDDALGIDLSMIGPDYVGIAKAASGNRLWGQRVEFGLELESALSTAVKNIVENKRSAVLEVVVN